MGAPLVGICRSARITAANAAKVANRGPDELKFRAPRGLVWKLNNRTSEPRCRAELRGSCRSGRMEDASEYERLGMQPPTRLERIARHRRDSRMTPDWEAHVVNAPALPLVLTGVDREAWLAALHTVASDYVCRWSLDQLFREPSAVEWRRIVTAIDELSSALECCRSKRGDFGPPVRSLRTQMATTRWWAATSGASRTVGRPRNRPQNDAIRDLLRLYWLGFASKPSRSPTGRAYRFITAFFDGVEPVLSWVYNRNRAEAGLLDGTTAAQRHPVLCPTSVSIPDLIRRALPGLDEAPLPRWWAELELLQPSYADCN
jgi:hypothetical protein